MSSLKEGKFCYSGRPESGKTTLVKALLSEPTSFIFNIHNSEDLAEMRLMGLTTTFLVLLSLKTIKHEAFTNMKSLSKQILRVFKNRG